MKIPQMFYLRKLILTVTNRRGKKIKQTVHVYWNYRNTVRGVLCTANRNKAKDMILSTNPEAEFWR